MNMDKVEPPCFHFILFKGSSKKGKSRWFNFCINIRFIKREYNIVVYHHKLIINIFIIIL